MTQGVFSLKEMTVAEVMTPRIDIMAVRGDASEAAVIEVLRSSEHARILVDEGSLDGVTGVLHAKDMLPRLGAADPDRGPWQELVRPARASGFVHHLSAFISVRTAVSTGTKSFRWAAFASARSRRCPSR